MAIKKRQQQQYSTSDSEEEHGYEYGSQEEEEQEDSEEELESDNEEEDTDDEVDDEEEEDKAEHLAKLKRDLAHVSFEQLAEIKEKMGAKDSSNENSKNRKKKPVISKDQILKDIKGAVGKLKKTNKVKRTKEDMKRENKHKPMEVSSKRAVGRFREVISLQSEKRRDPRFDKMSGKLNQDLFEKSYGFLNEYKKSELEMLKDRLRKEKDPEQSEHLKGLLLKMTSAEKMDQEKKRKQLLLRERKKQEAELVKEGKTPYFLKRSEKRKLDLMDRYEKLGAKSVDRILEKRRKRNTTKDRKHLPFNRRSATADS